MDKYFEVGDIVKINPQKKRTDSGVGLFEVTGYDSYGFIGLTKDETHSTFYTSQSFLMLVCKNTNCVDGKDGEEK